MLEAGVIRPSLEEFEALATQGNLIPVVREILADLDTPLSLFRRLDDSRTSFLLESVEGGEKWARFSFIGTGARAVFTAHGREVVWEEGGEKRVQVSVWTENAEGKKTTPGEAVVIFS